MRLVFLGTPDFAVSSLRVLSNSNHHLVGVVTQPDRPKGRGRRLMPPPVKIEAERLGVPILQPEKLTDPAFLDALRSWDADCFVVVGFRILPPKVFDIPVKGTINLHASLLPKYRGAAPIQWAIINGETKTGVSTFYIQRFVDTGDIILQEGVDIAPDDTAGSLSGRLAAIGAGLLLQTVELIDMGKVKRIPQVGDPTPAPKITPNHCVINWKKDAKTIINLIRGLSPLPGAFTEWQGKRLKIYLALHCESPVSSETQTPGTVLSVSAEGLHVQTGRGAICLAEVQLEGKRRMSVGEFIRGASIAPGDVFQSPQTENRAGEL